MSYEAVAEAAERLRQQGWQDVDVIDGETGAVREGGDCIRVGGQGWGPTALGDFDGKGWSVWFASENGLVSPLEKVYEAGMACGLCLDEWHDEAAWHGTLSQAHWWWQVEAQRALGVSVDIMAALRNGACTTKRLAGDCASSDLFPRDCDSAWGDDPDDWPEVNAAQWRELAAALAEYAAWLIRGTPTREPS